MNPTVSFISKLHINTNDRRYYRKQRTYSEVIIENPIYLGIHGFSSILPMDSYPPIYEDRDGSQSTIKQNFHESDEAKHKTYLSCSPNRHSQNSQLSIFRPHPYDPLRSFSQAHTHTFYRLSTHKHTAFTRPYIHIHELDNIIIPIPHQQTSDLTYNP